MQFTAAVSVSIPEHASRTSDLVLQASGVAADKREERHPRNLCVLEPSRMSAGGRTPFHPTLNTMTTIGPSLTITGEITSREDITIHGRLKGQVRMDAGALLVAPTGNVDAQVQGTRVTIHGTVAGDVAAAERIELTQTADVTGTLTAPTLVLQDGATFNGVVDMDKSKKKSKPAIAAA